MSDMKLINETDFEKDVVIAVSRETCSSRRIKSMKNSIARSPFAADNKMV